MRRIYFFVALGLLSTSFFSCKKGDGKPYIPASSANLIVGTWSLQTDHFVEYINNVKQQDTVYNAPPNGYVDIQFKTNGTFITSGEYSTIGQGSLGSGGSAVSFTSTGIYTFAGSVFNISGPVGGFTDGSASSFSTTTTVPVITPVSNSVQVNELTNTNLAIHTENIYTYTVNNVSQTYKIENDLSYIR